MEIEMAVNLCLLIEKFLVQYSHASGTYYNPISLAI